METERTYHVAHGMGVLNIGATDKGGGTTPQPSTPEPGLHAEIPWYKGRKLSLKIIQCFRFKFKNYPITDICQINTYIHALGITKFNYIFVIFVIFLGNFLYSSDLYNKVKILHIIFYCLSLSLSLSLTP